MTRATPPSSLMLVAHEVSEHEFEDVDPISNAPNQHETEANEASQVVEMELAPETSDSLEGLEMLARSSNPTLKDLQRRAAAARARADYVGKLPDPTIGVNIFGHPIETAAGAQRSNLTVKQMIPWLGRLDAQAKRVCLDAMALEQAYAAEKLRVIADLRVMWYRLYVLGKQIETERTNQELLKSLIDVANARVSTGNASQGDVLLGTLEYSKLHEQLVTLQQQVTSTQADMNRLIGRDAATPIDGPKRLDVGLPDWSHEMLREVAWENQPLIAAAQIRLQASCWGVEVARLQRRPDLSVSASWFAIDDDRPASPVVDVGRDAWSIGASVSLPIWHNKYDAIEREANCMHAASHASVDAVKQKFDAMLRDLWERAASASETAILYRDSILPQARQTLVADQQSYGNGTVEFDRVIRDFRNLVTLELGYHTAIGRVATALARIRQATATELASGNGSLAITSEPTRKTPPVDETIQ